MKHDPMFEHTGKCHICGEDTSLLIHEPCGKIADARRKAKGLRSRPKKIKYKDDFIDHCAKL